MTLKEKMEEEWQRRGIRCPNHNTNWLNPEVKRNGGYYEATETGLIYRPGRKKYDLIPHKEIVRKATKK